MEGRANLTAHPVNPQKVFWEFSSRLPDNCIITCDSGSAANWYARDLKVRAGMKASLSGGLATMCPGVPYATAGKFTHPDRVAIALVGDGAMQMLGINDLVTIARHWKEWTDPRLVVCVLSNLDLNQVTWEQRVLAGDPKFSTSQDVPDFPFARFAEMLGLKGIVVDAPEKIGPAWEEALAADRPVVIEARTDPNVPPLPPHINFEQARAYWTAIAKGDPDALGTITQSVKEMMESWLPRSRR